MKKEYEFDNSQSINVIEFENKAVDVLFVPEIGKSYDDLKLLLPNLPHRMSVVFGSNYDYGEDGVTWSALSSESMKIGIRADVDDRSRQFQSIQPLIFHEGYHIAQGFYNENQFSALESAVYEGCATVFEREYAGSTPKWGDYSKESDTTLRRWRDEMKDISAEQYFEPSGETWKKWAFYDAETDESWCIYKVGTWLVDMALEQTDANIVEFNSKTAADILSYLP